MTPTRVGSISVITLLAWLASATGTADAAQKRAGGRVDPELAKVTRVATEFLTALADGDRARAKELLDGAAAAAAGDAKADPGAEASLLDVYLEGVAASRRLRAALEGRLKADPEWTEIGTDAQLRQGATDIPLSNSLLLLDDGAGVATLTNGSEALARGLVVRRVGGEWKVDAGIVHPASVAGVRKRIAAETAALTRIADSVERDKFKTWEDAMRALGEEFEPEMRHDKGEATDPDDDEKFGEMIQPQDPRAAGLRIAGRELLAALAEGELLCRR